MEGLQIFENDELGKVRMLEIDGKPYAVGVDVARALGYAIPHKAVRDNCKGVLTWNILTDGGKQEVLIIPEGDIYRLIIKAADQSKNEKIKQKAEKFERWIFDEVLPQIRQTGKYISPNTEQDDKRWKFEFTASLLKDLGDSLSPESKNALLSNIFEELFGRPMLPKPAVRKTITASELAKRLGISAQKFGRLITKAGNIRNNPKYGLTILDKSKYSDKNVVNFAYFEDKAEEIIDILQPLIDKERKKKTNQ